MKLEDRLKDVVYKERDISPELRAQGISPALYLTVSQESREAIYKDLMELVGEDNDFRQRGMGDRQSKKVSRNELRAELRQKLAEYCGVKE